MKTFDVFEHPLGAPEAVKRGFSWPGFFFGWIWALVKGLVPQGMMILALVAAGTFLDLTAEAGGALSGLIGLGTAVAVGALGNGWCVERLLKQGYRTEASVVAGSPEAAVVQMLRERASRASNPHGPGIEARRPCPHCAEMILPGAHVCRYCGREVGAE